MNCDVCGRKFRPEAGQVTTDTILCGDCATRVRDKATELVREAVTSGEPSDPPKSCCDRAAEAVRKWMAETYPPDLGENGAG